MADAADRTKEKHGGPTIYRRAVCTGNSKSELSKLGSRSPKKWPEKVIIYQKLFSATNVSIKITFIGKVLRSVRLTMYAHIGRFIAPGSERIVKSFWLSLYWISSVWSAID